MKNKVHCEFNLNQFLSFCEIVNIFFAKVRRKKTVQKKEKHNND